VRILIAPDKFKGALNAREVAESIAAGLREVLPDAEMDVAPMADGGEITTVEGLGIDGKLDAVQEAFAECHGLQCGYCTPGILLSTVQLLEKHPKPTDEQIRKGIAGNPCRCTGYQNIFKSIRMAAAEMEKR